MSSKNQTRRIFVNSEILQSVLEQASALTSVLPENIQEVAFSKVFDTLLAERMIKSRGAGTIRSRRSDSHVNSLNSRRIGPKLALGQLLNSGYFAVRRNLPEINAYLRDSYGREYGSNELSISLLRLTRDGRLNRERDLSGQYQYWTGSIAADIDRHTVKGRTRLLTDGQANTR